MKGLTLPTETVFVMKMIGIEGETAMIRMTSYGFRLSLALAVVGTCLSATAARGASGSGTTPTLTYTGAASIGAPSTTARGTITPADLDPYVCTSCPGIQVTNLTLRYTADSADNGSAVTITWSGLRPIKISPPPPPPLSVVHSNHLDGFAIYDPSKFTGLVLSLRSFANDSDPTTLAVPVANPPGSFSGDLNSPTSYRVDTDFLGNGALFQYFQMTFSQVNANTGDTLELHLPGSVISNVIPVIPVVPFAAFAARLEVERHEGQFELDAVFNLGATSDGIQPLTEDVMLQIGTVSVTIPAGSFRAVEDENDGEHRDGMDRDTPGHEGHDRTGRQRARFTFEGVIDGVSLEVKLIQTGTSTFKLKAEGRGENLSGIINPVTIGLAIGDDGGSVSIVADFDE